MADIHALEEEMLEFERKYGILSETFYAGYISGEEPEQDKWSLDFGEWASAYQTWLARLAMYQSCSFASVSNSIKRIICPQGICATAC